MARRPLSEGRPHPLGATFDGEGVNFALFSAHATKVELCLFDGAGGHETARLALPEYTDEVWHGYLAGARPGQRYGYRVHGSYDPYAGHRFNPHKLLVDPYARALDRSFAWSDLACGYSFGDSREDLSFDTNDSAAVMPKGIVTDDTFDWQGDAPPNTPLCETVIYELHPRGYTMLHPAVPEAQRGTFAGLAHPDVIGYLRALGITAVELLPVHPVAVTRNLASHGLVDYWGYNAFNFFAPEPRYLSGGELSEFRRMVRALHAGGIEVILDVVFNHTGEGSELGPTLSFRGIDNASYYCLAEDRRNYVDYTGCRNTLNLEHPRVLQMVMDSLRYWVEAMHVDGFRFDLAVSLARARHHFSQRSPFFSAVAQDPVLRKVKLIAEPWDLGPDGYRLGGFPPGWSEWNDRYRDTARRFWRGDGRQTGELAFRLTGSSDLFAGHGRRPTASVNFVTAHDGFTLNDVVSYNVKHNAENREDSADGANENYSWNCGHEGPSEDPGVIAQRERQKRNLLATLLLSRGVPMLTAGDEFGRTQRGNNNAYCQDNETSWTDWRLAERNTSLLRFVQALLQLRAGNPVFRLPSFFHGEHIDETGIRDIVWLTPPGREMAGTDWNDSDCRALAVRYTADTGDFLLLLNAGADARPFHLPSAGGGSGWRSCIATDAGMPDGARYGSKVVVAPCSLVLLTAEPAARS